MHRCLILLALAAMALGADSAPTSQPTVKQRNTYVLVHGAWGGGWSFKQVDNLLSADGNKVYRPTLTGLGERVHLATPDIDLTTHITDIVNIILWEDLHDVVLVGHSYGGMVITGVVDRVPDRIKHVVYVDAFLPENGESLNTIGGRGGRGPTTNATARGRGPTTNNGFVMLGNMDPNRPPPHDVPQPAKTLSEPIVLKNQDAVKKIPTTYILTVDPGRQPEQDMFYRFYQRAKERGWTVETMEGDHNVQTSHPKELVELLERAP